MPTRRSIRMQESTVFSRLEPGKSQDRWMHSFECSLLIWTSMSG
jgi:hypothetical protein